MFLLLLGHDFASVYEVIQERIELERERERERKRVSEPRLLSNFELIYSPTVYFHYVEII